MTEQANRAIEALRSGHDELVAHVEKLSMDELDLRSGAEGWTVAQVLSHLGSGAAIMLAHIDAAEAGTLVPDDFNQDVWDRWNAMSPAEQRVTFVAGNAAFVGRFQDFDEFQLNDLRIDLPFLPEPADVGRVATLRLGEFTHHSWDVRVAADQAATLAPEAVPLLLDGLDWFFPFTTRPDEIDKSTLLKVELSDPERTFGLRIGDAVTLDDPEGADGTLTLPAEAWVRLTAGRLRPEHTPPGVEITGSLGLDDLRRLFPGY